MVTNRVAYLGRLYASVNRVKPWLGLSFNPGMLAAESGRVEKHEEQGEAKRATQFSFPSPPSFFFQPFPPPTSFRSVRSKFRETPGKESNFEITFRANRFTEHVQMNKRKRGYDVSKASSEGERRHFSRQVRYNRRRSEYQQTSNRARVVYIGQEELGQGQILREGMRRGRSSAQYIARLSALFLLLFFAGSSSVQTFLLFYRKFYRISLSLAISSRLVIANRLPDFCL